MYIMLGSTYLVVPRGHVQLCSLSRYEELYELDCLILSKNMEFEEFEVLRNGCAGNLRAGLTIIEAPQKDHITLAFRRSSPQRQ